MFAKLRSNYRLSSILLRIAFVLTFIFAQWQQAMASATYVTSVLGLGAVFTPAMQVAVGLLSSALAAVVAMLLLPFLVNLFLNTLRNYNIPRAEYVLLVFLYFCIGNFILGLLNLTHLFTPVLLMWGNALFPFIVFVGCVFSFYKVTAKIYFNDVTEPYYFRNLMNLCVILAVIFGVIL